MKSRSLIILAIVTVVAILAAVFADKNRSTDISSGKEHVFPQLSTQINDVHNLSLEKYGQSLSLVKLDNTWVIKEADNYPANFGKIKESVIAVSKLMILSNKTSNPDLYGRLGVEDPASEKSNSLLMSLGDAEGNVLATLIVGSIRHSKSADSQPGLYVRFPDSDTALLAEGRLQLSADIRDWFNRNLMDIDGARISSIVIERADAPVVSLHREKDTDDFSLDNIPEDKEIQSAVIITRMSTMLESLAAEGVRSSSSVSDYIVSTTRLSTFDGLQISISNAIVDGSSYASFSFSADDSETVDAGSEDTGEMDGQASVSEEAAMLNKVHSGWAYQIPDYKFELFDESLDDLVRSHSADDKEEVAAPE